MCGIVGIHGRIGGNDAASLRLAAAEIEHRGPDYTGVWTGEGLAVAHTRLSILDLSEAGHQPVASERFVLVYNGEIYNHGDLREELAGEGVAVRGSSDTAALFAYLARHGVERTLERIRGMFAFAWADLAERAIWLCRDRYGIKPLYYAVGGGALVFASEVKAIRRLMPVKPDPVRTLHAIGSTGDASPDRTVFEGVFQVAPGQLVFRIGEGEPRHSVYYDICREADEQEYRRLERMAFSEVSREFDSLLARSTKRMLMSDVPVGAFVSGGVDSALIAAIAHGEGDGVRLFTANVLGRLSEAEDARLLARALQAPLYEARFAPEDLLETLPQVTWHYECPVVTHANAAPLAAVARRAREEEVKAVLTGEGSDELFLGYPKMAATLMKPILRAPLTVLEKVYGLVPKLREFALGGTNNAAAVFLHDATRGFEAQRIARASAEAFGFLGEKERRWSAWSLESMQSHLLTLLHRNDRMGMSASIEARFPYLDEDVVRFGLNLPRKHKIRWVPTIHDPKHPFLEDKSPVRAAARRHLPRALSGKRKQGFPVFGLQFLEVGARAFEGGWVAETAGLRRGELEAMCREGDRYMVGKLLAVDVFGRLFGLGEPVARVTERLIENCMIRT